MFRIGATLFIPAYLLVIPLRPFAVTLGSENYVVMAGEFAISVLRGTRKLTHMASSRFDRNYVSSLMSIL